MKLPCLAPHTCSYVSCFPNTLGEYAWSTWLALQQYSGAFQDSPEYTWGSRRCQDAVRRGPSADSEGPGDPPWMCEIELCLKEMREFQFWARAASPGLGLGCAGLGGLEIQASGAPGRVWEPEIQAAGGMLPRCYHDVPTMFRW